MARPIPYLSPNDEFADYERWDKGNLDMTGGEAAAMLEFEYARSALKNGLKVEAELGTNPYKFGPGRQHRFAHGHGHHRRRQLLGQDRAERTESPSLGASLRQDRAGHDHGLGADGSGYAAVWATANTREALFDAMQRRETYGTTGPRMTVRFFGGWNYEDADVLGDLAAAGYSKGVPMGGDLSAAEAGKSPSLPGRGDEGSGRAATSIACRSSKGWLDAKGALHEQVYDVVWSDDRKPGADGKLPPVGNTVDVANATWTNTIGAESLLKLWRDPGFDPAQRAFYYVRVLEIPTPRWTAYDAKRFGVQMAKEVRMTTQERAYTSPIWYTPAEAVAANRAKRDAPRMPSAPAIAPA
jgi:hypothetical protein